MFDLARSEQAAVRNNFGSDDVLEQERITCIGPGSKGIALLRLNQPPSTTLVSIVVNGLEPKIFLEASLALPRRGNAALREDAAKWKKVFRGSPHLQNASRNIFGPYDVL